MSRLRRSIALLCLVPAAAAWPIDAGAQVPEASEPREPLVLSLEDALRMARANNPQFLAVRNDRNVADWSVRSAYASLFPSVTTSAGIGWRGSGEQRFGSLTASQLGFANQPSFISSSFNVGVNYSLSRGQLLAPGQAKASLQQTDARIFAARVDLDQRITTGYLDVLRQEEAVTLAELQIERSALNLRLARGQREVGRVTVIDVQQAEVQVGRSEVARLQALQALRTARLRLLQAIGVPVDREVVLTTDFTLTEPDFDADALREESLERSPVLLPVRSATEVADYDVKIARGEYMPSLSISTGISGFTQQPTSTDLLIRQAQAQAASRIAQCESTNELFRRLADPLPPQDCTAFVFTDRQRNALLERNDDFPFDFVRNTPSVSLSLSLPVFQGLGRQQRLEAAEAARTDARQELREQELAVAAGIRILVGSVETAYESARIEERNQALADEQLRLAREQYRLGAIPFLDLVDSETVKAEADQALLEAVFAYHDAITELEGIVGRPLRDR